MTSENELSFNKLSVKDRIKALNNNSQPLSSSPSSIPTKPLIKTKNAPTLVKVSKENYFPAKTTNSNQYNITYNNSFDDNGNNENIYEHAIKSLKSIDSEDNSIHHEYSHSTITTHMNNTSSNKNFGKNKIVNTESRDDGIIADSTNHQKLLSLWRSKSPASPVSTAISTSSSFESKKHRKNNYIISEEEEIKGDKFTKQNLCKVDKKLYEKGTTTSSTTDITSTVFPPWWKSKKTYPNDKIKQQMQDPLSATNTSSSLSDISNIAVAISSSNNNTNTSKIVTDNKFPSKNVRTNQTYNKPQSTIGINNNFINASSIFRNYEKTNKQDTKSNYSSYLTTQDNEDRCHSYNGSNSNKVMKNDSLKNVESNDGISDNNCYKDINIIKSQQVQMEPKKYVTNSHFIGQSLSSSSLHKSDNTTALQSKENKSTLEKKTVLSENKPTTLEKIENKSIGKIKLPSIFLSSQEKQLKEEQGEISKKNSFSHNLEEETSTHNEKVIHYTLFNASSSGFTSVTTLTPTNLDDDDENLGYHNKAIPPFPSIDEHKVIIDTTHFNDDDRSTSDFHSLLDINDEDDTSINNNPINNNINLSSSILSEAINDIIEQQEQGSFKLSFEMNNDTNDEKASIVFTNTTTSNSIISDILLEAIDISFEQQPSTEEKDETSKDEDGNVGNSSKHVENESTINTDFFLQLKARVQEKRMKRRERQKQQIDIQQQLSKEFDQDSLSIDQQLSQEYSEPSILTNEQYIHDEVMYVVDDIIESSIAKNEIEGHDFLQQDQLKLHEQEYDYYDHDVKDDDVNASQVTDVMHNLSSNQTKKLYTTELLSQAKKSLLDYDKICTGFSKMNNPLSSIIVGEENTNNNQQYDTNSSIVSDQNVQRLHDYDDNNIISFYDQKSLITNSTSSMQTNESYDDDHIPALTVHNIDTTNASCLNIITPGKSDNFRIIEKQVNEAKEKDEQQLPVITPEKEDENYSKDSSKTTNSRQQSYQESNKVTPLTTKANKLLKGRRNIRNKNKLLCIAQQSSSDNDTDREASKNAEVVNHDRNISAETSTNNSVMNQDSSSDDKMNHEEVSQPNSNTIFRTSSVPSDEDNSHTTAEKTSPKPNTAELNNNIILANDQIDELVDDINKVTTNTIPSSNSSKYALKGSITLPLKISSSNLSKYNDDEFILTPELQIAAAAVGNVHYTSNEKLFKIRPFVPSFSKKVYSDMDSPKKIRSRPTTPINSGNVKSNLNTTEGDNVLLLKHQQEMNVESFSDKFIPTTNNQDESQNRTYDINTILQNPCTNLMYNNIHNKTTKVSIIRSISPLSTSSPRSLYGIKEDDEENIAIEIEYVEDHQPSNEPQPKHPQDKFQVIESIEHINVEPSLKSKERNDSYYNIHEGHSLSQFSSWEDFNTPTSFSFSDTGDKRKAVMGSGRRAISFDSIENSD